MYPPLKRRDRALARTSVKFRWPYKLETTLDMGVLVLVARCEAYLSYTVENMIGDQISSTLFITLYI